MKERIRRQWQYGGGSRRCCGFVSHFQVQCHVKALLKPVVNSHLSPAICENGNCRQRPNETRLYQTLAVCLSSCSTSKLLSSCNLHCCNHVLDSESCQIFIYPGVLQEASFPYKTEHTKTDSWPGCLDLCSCFSSAPVCQSSFSWISSLVHSRDIWFNSVKKLQALITTLQCCAQQTKISLLRHSGF